MPKIPALNPLLQAWLLEGPLSAQVPAYVERLRRGRYATHTSGRCLNGVAHFAHWMSMCHLPARMLDEGCIDQFLRYHLPRCDCLGGALRTPTELHAALMPVLEILRAQGVIACAPAPTGPIADELSRYDAHMSSARGLAAGTRRDRLRIVERLLLSKFAGRPVAVSSLLPEDVRQFIVDQLQALGTTSNAITIASTLRAYLRYRATCGDVVQPLLAVIASPAHWSMASLPRGLKPEEVDRLLNSFTDALPSPKRGYAVVRLALDLGLRGIEISRLQLADIDWRLGTVTLKRTKSRRQDLLPCRSPRARPWRPTCDTNDPRPATEPCSCAAWRHTTNPSAWTPSDASSATPSGAPASSMAAAMRCATPWPVGSSTRAARSRRWPTCCGTGR
jgi:integrase/recombinase XerC